MLYQMPSLTVLPILLYLPLAVSANRDAVEAHDSNRVPCSISYLVPFTTSTFTHFLVSPDQKSGPFHEFRTSWPYNGVTSI